MFHDKFSHKLDKVESRQDTAQQEKLEQNKKLFVPWKPDETSQKPKGPIFIPYDPKDTKSPRPTVEKKTKPLEQTEQHQKPEMTTSEIAERPMYARTEKTKEYTEKSSATRTENTETKEVSRPEKFKTSTAFENEKKNDVRPVRVLEPNINANLAGKRHPETGVPFVERTIKNGPESVRGVFPQFEGKDVEKLPKDLYQASDAQQFSYCTQNLARKLERNPELKKNFTPRQLEQIRNGEPRISGLTWHHTEHPGRMQLVDSEIHSKTAHTGGRNVWGGGSGCR